MSPVNFPTSVDDNDSLYLTVNNLRTRLTAAINDVVTTIPVDDTTGFPSTGFVTILTGLDITKAEAISYTGTTPTSFTGATRGADGTTAVAHSGGDNVDLTIIAEHHNILKTAVIALENYIGITGDENFVPKDAQGNVVISGTLDVCGDTDFKQDSTISGTLIVGEIPPVQPPVESCTADEAFDTTLNSAVSFVDIGCELTVTTGTNLLLFQGNFGVDTAGQSQIRCLYDSTEAGNRETFFNQSATSSPDYWETGQLRGFKVVDSTGAQIAKLQAAGPGTTVNAQIGARAIAAVPLTELGFVEDTDYFFDNGSDTETDQGLTADTTIFTMTPTLPETGDYIVFAYVEAHGGDASGNDAIRYQLDSSDISPKYFIETNGFVGCPFIKVINIAAGSRTFTTVFNGGSDSPDIAKYRKARMCVIKASSFDQVVQATTSTPTTTASSSFEELSPKITYVPNQPEDLLVIANPEMGNDTNFAQVTYKLTESGSDVDYRIDSGGAVELTDENPPSLLFNVFPNAIFPSTWSVFHRKAKGSGNVVTESLNLLAIGITSSASAGDYPFTLITSSEVRSHKGTFDCIDSEQGITISGVDVIAGPHVSINVREVDSDPSVSNVTDLVVSNSSLTDDGGGQVTLNTNTLVVREPDSDPSVSNVNTIVVSEGTLIDSGGGVINLTTGGGAGGGVGTGATTSGTAQFRGVSLTTSSGVTLVGMSPAIFSSVLIPWDTEFYDTDGFHFGQADDAAITIPAGINKMKFFAQVDFNDATDDTGSRAVLIQRRFPSTLSVGISDVSASPSSDDKTTVQTVTPVIDVAEGETYKVLAFTQNATTGGYTLNFSTTQIVTAFAGIVIDPVTVTGIDSAIDLELINGFSGAIMSKSLASQTISNTTDTEITWDTSIKDEDAWIDLPNNRFFVPSGIGVTHVKLQAQAQWEYDGALEGGRRNLTFKKNGSVFLDGVIQSSAVAQAETEANSNLRHQVSSTVVSATEGDVFTLEAFQNSSGDLDIEPGTSSLTTWFAIERENSVLVSGTNFTSNSGAFSESLTISGIPTATGTSFSETRLFFTAPTSGAAATVENTVIINGGIIESWTQV